jgi:hypothetical protein
VIIPSDRSRALPVVVTLIAAIGGTLVASWYHRLGLTLSHYDARGHLIVARRIFDSITPGWQQIGAVWLPLPHLLNAIPVQIDLFYRTGASAIAISVASYAIATGAIAWIVWTLTDSTPAALAAAAVFAANPNVLYLQATPMTEPLLLATMTVGVAALMRWTNYARVDLAPDTSYSAPRTTHHAPRTSLVGTLLALACLTRYEAWPVTCCALAGAIWARRRHGEPMPEAVRCVAAIAIYPGLALIGFAIFSRVVVGQWFVSSDFFVAENKALGHPGVAVDEIAWGARLLSGALLIAAGSVGAVLLAAWGLTRRRADALIALSLVTTAAIPWAAFVKGHPFRIRYMVPLIVIEAVASGVLAGALPWRRARIAGAVALLALAAYDLRPLDLAAPMVVEAQWDRPNAPLRARVTACLGAPGGGVKIMASMGSLGHYMQEASASGFALRDFLHEGNGDIWLAALENPWPFANWILIEEKAEGGDMLARIAREHPSFLDGYQRTCEGAGLALYKRIVPRRSELEVHREQVIEAAELDLVSRETLIQR